MVLEEEEEDSDSAPAGAEEKGRPCGESLAEACSDGGGGALGSLSGEGPGPMESSDHGLEEVALSLLAVNGEVELGCPVPQHGGVESAGGATCQGLGLLCHPLAEREQSGEGHLAEQLCQQDTAASDGCRALCTGPEGGVRPAPGEVEPGEQGGQAELGAEIPFDGREEVAAGAHAAVQSEPADERGSSEGALGVPPRGDGRDVGPEARHCGEYRRDGRPWGLADGGSGRAGMQGHADAEVRGPHNLILGLPWLESPPSGVRPRAAPLPEPVGEAEFLPADLLDGEIRNEYMKKERNMLRLLKEMSDGRSHGEAYCGRGKRARTIRR